MEEVRIGDLLLEHYIPEVKKDHYSLLFVHGAQEGSWIFNNWAQAAAKAGREVYAINLRGHSGRIPVENLGKVSIMDYVDDVKDVLRKIGPAILIGRSMGGLIAQIVADWDPSIPGVVFMNSAPGHGISPASWATLSRYWKPQYLIASMLKRPLQPQEGDMKKLIFNNMSPSDAKATFQKLVPESGLAARELTFWRWRGPETKLYCPVLVIGATKDRLTPVSIQKKIARKYKATYKEFPGAHLLPLEQGWEAPIEFILQWAADHNL